MIKKLIKIYLFFVIIFNISNLRCIATPNYYEAEKKNYDSFGADFNTLYQTFVDSIGKFDLKDVSAYWCRIRDYNDKLIIGGSGVVYCGYTMGDDIDRLGYDVVGFGGMCDDKIKDWIPKIKKKYKKVIIFEGVNTVNLALGAGFLDVSQDMIESVLTTIAQVQINLLDIDGVYQYVKVVPMTKGRDNENPMLVKKFNKISKSLNNALAFINIPLYEITFPTTKEYSSGYVHFNNKVVWEHMLK